MFDSDEITDNAGMCFTDIEEVGFSVVAITDNDVTLGQHIAKTIADHAWSMRLRFIKPLVPLDEAVARAMSPEAQASGRPGPIILADCADNCGGGGAGDTTVILKALLDAGGKEIIVTSWRTAPNDAEIFRHIGINPSKKKILVVKSVVHFRAGYEPLAKEIIEVDCPGATTPNLSYFNYRKVRRPLFPIDPV